MISGNGKEIIIAIERMKRRLSTIEDESARRLLTILIRTERTIALKLQRGLVSDFDLNKARELVNQISRISETGLFAQSDWLQQTIPDLMIGGLAVNRVMLGIAGFSAEDIVATFRGFEGTDAYTALLNQGYQTWWNEILGRNETYLRTLQSEITRGAALGLDGPSIAENLIEASKKLNLDVADPEVWANRLVRTEGTRLTNDIGVAFNEDVGIERFWNLGVADERQSDICAEASQQEPMTKDEWAASEFGLAPRHPNCRCQLIPWDDSWGDVKELLTAQQEAGEMMVV